MLTVLGATFILAGCHLGGGVRISEGDWLGQLEVMDNELLPFNFRVTNGVSRPYSIDFFNAEEVIRADEIELWKDSIKIKLPVFEGYLIGKVGQNEMSGSFIKESLDREVPFRASFDKKDRFAYTKSPSTNISGVWETRFYPETGNEYLAKGIFKQIGSKITGTFRTVTGDYRFLEGSINGDSIKLSTFDGAHAFLFTAHASDSAMKGTFYSGNHSKELFEAKRNENFELPDEDSLTYLKNGFDKFSFSFPDSNDTMVSLSDQRFQGKVVLVQIMGTWCPNCLDETKFFVNHVKQNKDRNLEIVALAFETAKTKEGAFKAIKRLQDRIGVPYPILLAQIGTSDKVKAQEKLPMLNHVLSYPTTLFIDKQGKVRKIHTGFNGPATGESFVNFKRQFTDFVSLLLAE